LGGLTSAQAVVERSSRSGTSEADRYARSLIDVSRNPLVSIDTRGKITDVNAATADATGIPREQLIGSDFADCFSEPEKARAAYRRVLEEGLLSNAPLVLRHFSGALTEVEYNAAVYRDAGGELRAVFAAARNAAEAQEVRRQVARIALVAASSHDAVYSRDLEGTIMSWNAAAEALYGYAAEEAIGRDGTILLVTRLSTSSQSHLYATVLATLLFHTDNFWVGFGAALGASALLLVFGEIVPKSLFRRYAHRLCMTIADALNAMAWLCAPMVLLVGFIMRMFVRLGGAPEAPKSFFVTREELKHLAKEGEAGGALRVDKVLSPPAGRE